MQNEKKKKLESTSIKERNEISVVAIAKLAMVLEVELQVISMSGQGADHEYYGRLPTYVRWLLHMYSTSCCILRMVARAHIHTPTRS